MAELMRAAKRLAAQPVAREGLDELWAMADRIGKPSLERTSLGDYRATIMCNVDGSTVFAQGRDRDSVIRAMQGAIEAAYRFGAVSS